MKTFFKKNIGVLALVAAILFSSQLILRPQTAHGQIVSDIITELETALTYVESKLGAVSGAVSAVEQTASTLQDTVLDKIAVAIAKELLMQITDDVVNWIDTGFNGNPAFIQNPTAFFLNVGDQATGAFISSSKLSALCSPFSLQIRLALIQQQQQNDGVYTAENNPYSCTLSTIIQNGVNAVQGASINGFTAGDFSQGGWPAFAAMVTEPQNTPNGAYLMTEDELQQKIQAQVTQKQNELNQGGGFLSWESCTGSTGGNSNSSSADYSPFPDVYGNAYNTGAENDPTQTCTIQTPGSTISAALNRHLAVPTDNLLLANSVNDIINAVFTTLITKTLQEGLASLTSPSSGSGGSSYLQNLADQQGASNPAFQSSQQTTLQAVSSYVTIESQIVPNYDSALATASTATTTIDQANSCFLDAQTAVESASSTLDASTTAAALSYITYQLGRVSYEEATITPIVADISNKDQQANDTLNTYSNINNEVQNAQSVNDLAQPNQELQSLIQSGNIPIQTDVTQSQQDLISYQAQIAPIQASSTALLSECQAFVPSDPTTYNTQ